MPPVIMQGEVEHWLKGTSCGEEFFTINHAPLGERSYSVQNKEVHLHRVVRCLRPDVVFFVRWCPLCFSEGLDSRFKFRSACSGLLCVVIFAATFAPSFFGVVTLESFYDGL